MKEIENILKEIISQVQEFRNVYITNEQAVRSQLIEPILNALGWKTSNPNFVRPNAPDEDGKVPDYTLIKEGKTTLIVEAKNLSADLKNKKIINQLAFYCFNSGIDFGVLSNGVKWLLFKTFENNPKDRIVWQVDLEKDSMESVINNLSSFAYLKIGTLDALLKNNKLLENGWNLFAESSDSVVTIVAQKVLEKIKTQEPAFKIDQSELKNFTKGKLMDLFELTEIQREKWGILPSNIGDINKTVVSPPSPNSIMLKKIREKVSVTFPDNFVINHKKVVDTFIDTVCRIGIEKVKQLGLSRAGVQIVTEKKDANYNQHQNGKYWIMVHTSTKEKVAILNEINKQLNLNLIVKTITI